MKKKIFISLLALWTIVSLVAVILSFTQVDLNLTFINWQPYLNIQSRLTFLGYYQRETNALYFSALFIALHLLYGATLFALWKKKLSSKQLWLILVAVLAVLFFAYNAFSRDIFNYI